MHPIHRLRYHGLVSSRQHAGPAPTGPEIPEPSLAERARTLAMVGRMGSLSTQSRKFSGFPFGSMMPYAADHQGRPVMFISSMAMHTQNLVQNPSASLLITQPDAAGDPLGSARVTLIGTAATVSSDEVRELYLSRYENARFWQDYTDFAYYRLEIEGVYFIGGFGVMGWVPADEYAAAAPDPLAFAAQTIMAEMNARHGELLRRLTIDDDGATPDAARMTAIDRLGFHLRLQSGDRVFGRRFAFPREVRDGDEVQ